MSRWRAIPLGDIATIQSGIGFPVELQGRRQGKYPFAKVGDISRLVRSGQSGLSEAENYVDEEDLDFLRVKPIPAGSIVFAKIGEAIRQNFRAITTRPLLIDNNVMSVTPRGDILDVRFAYHFLRSLDLYQLADSTTVPSIRKTTVWQILVPVPPIDEQCRISRNLDAINMLLAKRQRALGLHRKLVYSIFIEMFGDPNRNPMRWPDISLSKAIIYGPNNGLYKPASYYGSRVSRKVVFPGRQLPDR